ncbi:MAG TPA: GNVR domain-containing protein [Gemmatimonadales bacterium]|nr:GNVR domain-containing protein [Gemmatimonadales bacterium]
MPNLGADDHLPPTGAAAVDSAIGKPLVGTIGSAPAPIPSVPSLAGEEDGIDWSRYLATLSRHRWWIVLAVALGSFGGYAATRVIKPVYVVQATVWVDQPDRVEQEQGPIREGHLLEAVAWVDLLRSFAVLDSVVRERHLYISTGSTRDTLALVGFDIADRFRPGAYGVTVAPDGRSYTLTSLSDKIVIEHGTVGDSIGRRIGFLWVPPAGALAAGRTMKFRLVMPRDASRRLYEELSAHLAENGSFMALQLSGTDPGSIAATMNTLVDRYVQVAAELKRAKLTELTHILSDQLTSAASNLRDAESALEVFRVHTITMPSEQATPVAPGLQETRDPVFRNFFEMRIEREQLSRDRLAIEHAVSGSADSDALEQLAVVGAVQRSSELTEALHELTAKRAELRALHYRYTDEFPTVRHTEEAIETLQHKTIPALAHTLLGELQAREQVLDSLVGSAGFELRQIPQRAVEEARLRREVVIAEAMYTTLQQRYEEARLAAASTIPDIRVLDPAVVPQRPVKNTKTRFLLMGLIGGLGMGLAGVVLADRLDTRIRYPKQVTHEMGLAILGAIPRLPKEARDDDMDQSFQVLEALRTLRLNIAHAYGTGPILLTITSPGPGDGKSFVASNLARAFADAGQRTLLIDGDARRGVVHRVLGGSRKPGLIDCLSDQVEIDAILQPTDHPLLRFVASGTRQGDAPELLGSPVMIRVLTWARANHEVVIVDSPPLGAGVDPFVLGTLTGSLVLVLRTGSTDRALAQFKLEGIDRLPIRVLGAILNDVRASGVYRYYGYLSGYRAESEPRRAARALPFRGGKAEGVTS